MKYYWTALYNKGEFYFWKVSDEKELLKLASKLYCGKMFDYGETTENSYGKGRKGNE